MGLFVMRFSINKLQEIKNKDKAILNAYRVNGNGFNNTSNPTSQRNINIRAKNDCPLYQSKKINNYSGISGNFMWLLGK